MKIVTLSFRMTLTQEKGVWIRCDYATPYLRNQNSTLAYHLDLTARGYRALIYSGDHDMIVPTVGTEQWIKSLNFSIVDEWRPWMVDGQVAGGQGTRLRNTSPRNALRCSNERMGSKSFGNMVPPPTKLVLKFDKKNYEAFLQNKRVQESILGPVKVESHVRRV
ncbi:hypothetical protein ACLOJK_036037 [Asimina triloba]